MTLDDELPSAYAALLAKADAFVAGVEARREADIACAAGCSGCCQVQLTVSPVEAQAIREHLAAQPAALRAELRDRATELTETSDSPCVMQDTKGRCAIYGARPLVCRTQGMALAYPSGFVALEAVMASGGEHVGITWCPLNYTLAAPRGQDVLDAQTLDRMLAILNERRGAETGERSTLRVLLSVLCAAC